MSRAFLALSVIVLASTNASAAEPPPGASTSTGDFVVANVLFTITHELGHALIDEFSIPILGNEEDAADTLATIGILIKAEGVRHDELSGRLLAAADGWRLQWEAARDAKSPIAYFDEHPLDIQRFYRIICFVHGSDPDRFEALGRVLDDASRWTCKEEFEKRRRAVTMVIDTFGRRAASDAPHASRLRIEYEVPSTPTRRELLDPVRDSATVERAIAAVDEQFELPRPIVIAFVNCAEPTAYWNSRRSEIVVCYGLLEHFAQLSARRKNTVDNR